MTEKEILDHHIGFATAELKAKLNNEKKYILLLLSDAHDALSIDWPDKNQGQKIALQRVDMALKHMKKDIK